MNCLYGTSSSGEVTYLSDFFILTLYWYRAMGCSCFRGTRPGYQQAAAAATPTGEKRANSTITGAPPAVPAHPADTSAVRVADAAAGSRPSSAVPPISFSNREAGDANDSRLSPSPPSGGLAVAGEDGSRTGRPAFAEGADDEAEKASQQRVSERKLSCAMHVPFGITTISVASP